MSDCSGELHPQAREGLRLFNVGEFFEAPEALENAWNAEDGDAKDLYRGILQIAVTYLHITRGNYNGAIKVYERSKKWLNGLPDICKGVHVRRLQKDAEIAINEIHRLGADRIGRFKSALMKPVQWDGGKQKPQVERHYLFFPKEKFPHQGTFWGIYNEIPVGHTMVLGFLSTQTRQWNLDEQYAIERVAHFTNLILERVMLNQTCDRLQNFDACTGIYNAPAFESLVEEQIAESLQSGVSSALVVLQFTPWESLFTQF